MNIHLRKFSKVTTYGYMLSSYFKCIKTKIKLVMVFCYVLCQ